MNTSTVDWTIYEFRLTSIHGRIELRIPTLDDLNIIW